MNDDMSELMSKLNGMLSNNEISDNLKNILNSFSSEKSNSGNKNSEKNVNDNIDPEMILKITQIMKAMKQDSSNPRANLLRSLKPYLNSSRQDKVEQYIQLFNVEKIIDLLNNGGGKNDL